MHQHHKFQGKFLGLIGVIYFLGWRFTRLNYRWISIISSQWWLAVGHWKEALIQQKPECWTDVFGTWLHSCLCNVRQKKKKKFISYTVATQGQLFLLEKKKEFWLLGTISFVNWPQIRLSLDLLYLLLNWSFRALLPQINTQIGHCSKCISDLSLCVCVSVCCPKAHLGFKFLFSIHFWILGLLTDIYYYIFFYLLFATLLLKIIKYFSKEKKTYQNVFSIITLT